MPRSAGCLHSQPQHARKAMVLLSKPIEAIAHAAAWDKPHSVRTEFQEFMNSFVRFWCAVAKLSS